MLLTTASRRFLIQLEADGRSPLTTRVYRGELDRFEVGRGEEPRRGHTPRRHRRLPDRTGKPRSPDGTDRSTRTVNRTRTALRLFFGYLAHTFATRLQERTGDLRIVQAALGHRQLATTEVYTRPSSADVRQAVGR
jgi:site-specific recombinase XerD